MIALVVVGATIAAAVLSLWRYASRPRPWQPPRADEAVAVACDGLGISEPRVSWQRGIPNVDEDGVTRFYFMDRFGRCVSGLWERGSLVIAKGDGQPFSQTALPFELAREARMQREGVRDESEPTADGAMPPTLVNGYERARAALIQWEARGHA